MFLIVISSFLEFLKALNPEMEKRLNDYMVSILSRRGDWILSYSHNKKWIVLQHLGQ